MIGRLRKGLRISLRTLIIAILLLAVWLGYQVHRARDQLRAIEAIRAAGGWVRYADEFAMGPVNVPRGNRIWEPSWGTLTPGSGPRAPAWLRRAIGDEYFREIAHVSTFVDLEEGSAAEPYPGKPPVDDTLRAIENQRGIRTLQIGGATVTGKGLDSVAKLTDLRELFIWWATGIDDAAVAHIGRLPRLRVVDIHLSALTDEGVGHLAGLPELEELSLEGKKFTDASLAHLSRAKHLKSLELQSRPLEITDAGLEHLKGLKELRLLDLQKAHITESSKARLLKSNPKLRIQP
jgi:hypothetical protein